MNTETTEKSLEEVLAESMDAMEAGTLEVPESPELEIDQQPEQQAALAGEQPAADAAEAPQTTESPADAVQPTDKPGETAAQASEQEAEPAPQSWRKDAAAKWKDVPAEIRAEILRRENDYHRGVESYKPAVMFAQEIGRAIEPYARNIQLSGVPVSQAIHTLLMTEDKLRNGDPQTKAQALVKIAQDYGIDLSQAANVAPPDPNAWHMEQQLHRERLARQHYEQQITVRDQSAVESEIQEFARAEGHEHFPVVKQDMAAMLQSGIATDLKDAYNKAVWARPDLRQSLVEKERTEAEKRALEQARRGKAKSAAVGVKGSAPSSSGALQPNASIEEVLAAAMDGQIS